MKKTRNIMGSSVSAWSRIIGFVLSTANRLYTAVFTRDTREILLHMDKKFSLDREIVQEILFG